MSFSDFSLNFLIGVKCSRGKDQGSNWSGLLINFKNHAVNFTVLGGILWVLIAFLGADNQW